MTSAQVLETSVTNNSSFQNYPYPDDQTIRTTFHSSYRKSYSYEFGNILRTVRNKSHVFTKSRIQKRFHIQLVLLQYHLFYCNVLNDNSSSQMQSLSTYFLNITSETISDSAECNVQLWHDSHTRPHACLVHSWFIFTLVLTAFPLQNMIREKP